MERSSHSPDQDRESLQGKSSMPLDFHHHMDREKTNKNTNSSSNNNPNNLSVKRDERSKSKSPHLNNHSHSNNQYHPSILLHQNHHSFSSSLSMSNNNGGQGNNSSSSSGHKISSRGHYSPSNSESTASASSSSNNNAPLTKNVGVGANLNLSGRHSSASVSVGHGLLGSINGPSSVSISTGLNSPLSISAATSNSSGGGNNNHGNSVGGVSSVGSGRGGLNRDSLNVNSQGHQSIPSHSPGLIPSTILPELLQAHAHAAAVAAAASAATSTQSSNNSGGNSTSTNSSSSTSNNNTPTSTSSTTSSRSGNGIVSSNLNNNNTNATANPTTTKVGISSPAKQGILGRQPRGEMINGSTATTTTASKIVSQNVNGTLELTGIPTNDSELQLFRVLQRANLLSYFDVMIELGGDDVQQLCEAGEEEFLEIMALIGMASKPLHVRRLQKALQEWMSNPNLFQSPVLPPGVVPFGGSTGRAGSGSSSATRSGTTIASPIPVPATSHLAQLPQITSPNTSSTPSASTPLALQINPQSGSGGLPIRPIPYHSGVGGPPSAAAAMAAAAAAAAQQGVFFTPSEIKSLQNKLQVMTNGHNNHNLNGTSSGGGGGRGSSSSSPTGSSGPLLVRNSHQSPTNHSSASAASGSSMGNLNLNVNHSFSNGYHHHAPITHHDNHSQNHHRFDRESGSGSSGSHKEKDHHHQIHHLVNPNSSLRIPADQIIPSHFLEQRIRTASEPNSPAASESPSESLSSLSPVPFLQELEIFKLAEAAVQIVKKLPPYVFEPQLPPKRKFKGDFEQIMLLPLSDPKRIDEIRKASMIYGRPDSSNHPKSRKFPKPLSMHEVSVNEAAAQLCRHVPALVTRREELFALAKQVVRDAGLPYSNNNFSISLITNSLNNNNNSSSYSNHNLKHKRDSHQIELNHHLNSLQHHLQNDQRDNNGFNSGKRLRMDAEGIEIQEYNRPPSNNSELASDSQDNAMQITPIRNLPRRSLSDDQHSPLPLELVTVTTSSPHRSSDSGSPPSSMHRRSTESEDLINGFKLVNNSPSIKITSIPVSGGLINISHDQSITGSSGSLTLLPIKTEPAN